MIRRFSSLALVAALALAAAPAQAAPFGRTQREMAAGDGLGDTLQAVAEKATQTLTDAWANDPTLKIGRKLVKGGAMGDFIGQMAGGKELEQVFSNPIAAHTVINRFPMFQAFEGVKELAAKSVDDFTEADGLRVLESFRAFAVKGAKAMASVADPAQYAKFMGRYADLADGATPENPKERRLQELLGSVQEGDEASVLAFHDEVVQDVWGETVDLKMFGSDGSEPATLKQLRELAMSEPDFWSVITGGDPFVEKILGDPTLISELRNFI